MYSLLLAPIVSAFYYKVITTEEPLVVQEFTGENIHVTTEEPLVVQEFTTSCEDVRSTVTEETSFDFIIQEVTETKDCSSETVSVYTTDVFVVNSVESSTVECNVTTSVEDVSTTDVFVVNSVESSTVECNVTTSVEDVSTTDVFVVNSIEYNVTTSVEDVSTTDVFVVNLVETSTVEYNVTTSVEDVSTTNNVEVTSKIAGDIEGFPKAVKNEDLPEITIEEINEIEVSQIRDDGLEFCNAVGLGNVVANGSQQQFQTCSLTVQGAIPAIDKMVSTIIMSPENNAKITMGTNFTIIINSLNIEYGFFDDPASLYYLSPQRLNSEGIIQGHNHVAIQKLLGPGEVPSAQNPLFFKGLNEVSFDGTLSAEVDGSLFTEKGEYRLCTSSASQGHQPVLSPVARRFFQDDCIRFTIVN